MLPLNLYARVRLLIYLARETAGAARIRSSLRPSWDPCVPLGIPASLLGSPASLLGSPASLLGSPASLLGSPASLLGSPASLLGSPASLLGSPASLLGSPASLLGSPASLLGSPASLLGSPASLLGSPASLLGSPASLLGSPLRSLVQRAGLHWQNSGTTLPRDCEPLFGQLRDSLQVQLCAAFHTIACGKNLDVLPVIGFSSSRIDRPQGWWSTNQLPSTGYWPENSGSGASA